MKHASVHALRQDWHYSDNMAADLWQDEVMKTGLLLLAWLAGVPFADAAQAKEDALCRQLWDSYLARSFKVNTSTCSQVGGNPVRSNVARRISCCRDIGADIRRSFARCAAVT